MLLREQQAELAEEQWEATKAMADEQRDLSRRQEEFAKQQRDVTEKTQRSSKRAAWVAACAAILFNR